METFLMTQLSAHYFNAKRLTEQLVFLLQWFKHAHDVVSYFLILYVMKSISFSFHQFWYVFRHDLTINQHLTIPTEIMKLLKNIKEVVFLTNVFDKIKWNYCWIFQLYKVPENREVLSIVRNCIFSHVPMWISNISKWLNR